MSLGSIFRMYGIHFSPFFSTMAITYSITYICICWYNDQRFSLARILAAYLDIMILVQAPTKTIKLSREIEDFKHLCNFHKEYWRN